MKVLLDSVDKIKTFSRLAGTFEENIDVICGRYVIDGKSIMGLLSIDLLRPLTVYFHSSHIDRVKEFEEAMKDFIVEEE